MVSVVVLHAASAWGPEADADGDPDPEVPADCVPPPVVVVLDGAPAWLVLPEWQAAASDTTATVMTAAGNVPRGREIVRI
jgi:hypothetical protein